MPRKTTSPRARSERRRAEYPNLRRGAASDRKSAEKPKRNTSGLKRGGSPGRPRGSRNRTTREAKALAESILQDAAVQARLLADARRGKLPPAVMVMLFHYAYGKPKESVELELVEELRVVITDELGDEPTSAPVEEPTTT
jgi:hypothetical protein